MKKLQCLLTAVGLTFLVSATPAIGHVHSMSQVTGLTSALNGKADVDHDHNLVYQQKYANVVVVAKSGGDFTDPVAAVNSITDASSTNPWLVKIMPGVYEIGGGALGMKPYVDVEGSGESITKIRGVAESPVGVALFTASNTELREITVELVGPCSQACYAIAMQQANPASLFRVTALASGTGTGTAAGIYAYWDSIVYMKDVTARASASGAYMNWGVIFRGPGVSGFLEDVTASAVSGVRNVGMELTGSIVLRGVAVSASGSSDPSDSLGVHLNACPSATFEGASVTSEGTGIQLINVGMAKVNYSSVSGSLSSISLPGVDPVIAYVGNSQLEGPIYTIGHEIKCIGAFDANYDPIVCP